MFYTDQQKYWIWLSSIQGVGASQFYQLINEYGEPAYVWDQLILAKRLLTPAVYAHLKKARSQDYLDELFGQMEESGTAALIQMDDDYPDRLRSIPDAPPTLFVRGNRDALNAERAFAIVGSRKVTVDGARFTESIAERLAQNGVTIMSGLALGADRRAHEGCLNGGSPTVAVLASGPEIIYPRENEDVAQRILDEGGALASEYRPGVKPATHHFPARNRIISGLSDGVLMPEGTARSGAMITMNYALVQNRPRFAVPGSVYASASEGPNHLLVDGALACLGEEQVLSYFGWKRLNEPEAVAADALAELDETSRQLVEILKFEEKSFDELANIMKMSPSGLNSLLTILEMQGIIRQSAGKLYRTII